MGRVSNSSYDLGASEYSEAPSAFSWAEERLDGPFPAKKTPFTVTGALGLAQKALQDVTVRLVGEVSEVSAKAGYKAVYFTVKDQKSCLSCMMWNNRYVSSGVDLKVGMEVELSGRFTLYAARGTMNFDVFTIKLTGEGELRARIAQMMQKLAAEGLTAPERKRALPQYPQRIGLVTSPRGATVHDVLRTLRQRYAYGQVLFAGVQVEGAGAPAALIQGLDCVVKAGAEVVLLIRGGGSIESLMPFNDEGLARAIAACPVPVVTGIGHETDTTVADLVADLRTLTPTAAATAVSPDSVALRMQLDQMAKHMHGKLASRLELSRAFLARYAEKPVLKDAGAILSPVVMELDGLQGRLQAALPERMRNDAAALELLRVRLATQLSHCLEQPVARQAEAAARLQGLAPRLLNKRRQEVGIAAAQLEALSPVAVLARGYSIARTEDQTLLKSVDQVACGQEISVTVADGVVQAEVSAVHKAQQY